MSEANEGASLIINIKTNNIMKWIEIYISGNRTILNVDKIIEIKTYKYNEQYSFNIYYQSGQSKECISLSFTYEHSRDCEYNRLLDFLICTDKEIICI